MMKMRIMVITMMMRMIMIMMMIMSVPVSWILARASGDDGDDNNNDCDDENNNDMSIVDLNGSRKAVPLLPRTPNEPINWEIESCNQGFLPRAPLCDIKRNFTLLYLGMMSASTQKKCKQLKKFEC